MSRELKELLAKLDRIVLLLTEARLDARTNKDWEIYNEAAWSVRNARKELAQ